jgi:hypothetical protein
MLLLAFKTAKCQTSDSRICLISVYGRPPPGEQAYGETCGQKFAHRLWTYKSPIFECGPQRMCRGQHACVNLPAGRESTAGCLTF